MPRIGFRSDLGWGFVAQARMWSDGIVALLSSVQDVSCAGERGEECLVQAFMTETTVEAFNEAVLHWRA